MIRQPAIFLFIPLDLLLFALFKPTMDLFLFFIQLKVALNDVEVGIVFYVLTIYRIYKALAERKMVYGIEEVGFPAPIITYKTVEPGAEV